MSPKHVWFMITLCTSDCWHVYLRFFLQAPNWFIFHSCFSSYSFVTVWLSFVNLKSVCYVYMQCQNHFKSVDAVLHVCISVAPKIFNTVWYTILMRVYPCSFPVGMCIVLLSVSMVTILVWHKWCALKQNNMADIAICHHNVWAWGW